MMLDVWICGRNVTATKSRAETVLWADARRTAGWLPALREVFVLQNAFEEGHANGPVQIAQHKVGPGKVQLTAVLNIDATFLQLGILVLYNDATFLRCDIPVWDGLPDIQTGLSQKWQEHRVC